MAWTDPIATAVTGEIAPASMWNAVRDNFALVGPHLIVRKPSDEGPISSTTFQADDHLLAPVAANEVWLFQFITRWVSGSNSVKMRWTFPSSPVMAAMDVVDRDSAGTISAFAVATATSPLDPGIPFFAPTSFSGGYIVQPITIMFANGANAGNFALEWAPNTAVNTTCKANSTLWGVKLA